jgi:RsiW-degrading membrane proteinase PrsW (M82 family)
MSSDVHSIELILLFIMAFLPPIIYVVWIRNTEKFHREKWKPIFLCFIWGATIAIIVAIVLEFFLHLSIAPSINDSNTMGLITVIIIAPFAEELTKPLALGKKTVRKELDELEDGLIYGAVAGLGFSATENLLYGLSFLEEGLLYFLILISIRSFGGCLLHASATAWTGYGYGKSIMKRSSLIRVIPYFLLAILVHALYNALLSFDFIGIFIGLIAALTLAFLTIQLVRSRIRTLDQSND